MPVARIYLAGPEVFLPAQRRESIAREKRRILEELGLEGLDPMDNGLTLADSDSPMAQGQAIYQANIRLIRGCDGALVNLSPFRGPSADAGTVFETGFLAALGKPMVGYTCHAGDYEQRVRRPGNGDVDEWGRAVERFGQVDNLMIESAILAVGGRVLRGDTMPAEGAVDFDAPLFVKAARALAVRLRQGRAD